MYAIPVEDLREQLGAGPPAGTLQVTLFVPSVDRDGHPIDQALWREASLRVFGRLFRGATAFPPGRGVWRGDARGGELVFDNTVLVTSYVDPAVPPRIVAARAAALPAPAGSGGSTG